MRRSLGVLAVLAILTVGCGDDDGSAEPVAADEPTPTNEGAPYPDSPACDSYIAFRDLIQSKIEEGLSANMEDYIIEAKAEIEQMRAVAAEDAAQTLTSYRESIDALVAPFEANDWKPFDIDAVPGEIVRIVEETGFDATEQQVWEWAASVCGAVATNCRGFLGPLIYSPPLEGGGDLYYLIDPATCSADG